MSPFQMRLSPIFHCPNPK